MRGGLGEGSGEDETRTEMCGGVLGSQRRSDEGDRGATRERREWLRSEEKRKRNISSLCHKSRLTIPRITIT